MTSTINKFKKRILELESLERRLTKACDEMSKEDIAANSRNMDTYKISMYYADLKAEVWKDFSEYKGDLETAIGSLEAAEAIKRAYDIL